MKHISKLYLIIIFIVLLGLSFSILFFAKESHNDKLQELSRYIIDDFQKGLAYENADLLSFSLALSEDGAFAPCSLYLEKKKGQNNMHVAFPSVYNWMSSMAIDNKEDIAV